MRQVSYLGMAILNFLLVTSCTQSKDNVDYLRIVLDNLEQIKSASYYSTSEGWVPGDTAASSVRREFTKEYNNPSDTTIGASFVGFMENDTTLARFCYDGKMRAYVNHDKQTIKVDSFTTERFPFRTISPPFFNYTKSILKYALETTDSISLQMEENEESVYVCLTIFEDTQIEFFGKAFRMPVYPEYYVDPISKYELWIDKKTDLPYKKRREMGHDISVETISNVDINGLKNEDFVASSYFPDSYTLLIKGENRETVDFSEVDLFEKTAPEWSLYSADDQLVSLKDIKSKVTILMFTSISCGPCKIAIPVINQLVSEYDKKEVEIVAVECASRSMRALKMYRDNNDIRYTWLQSNEKVLTDYGIFGYPIFFVLDENHVVKKIINGYNQKTFGKEIRETIHGLL